MVHLLSLGSDVGVWDTTFTAVGPFIHSPCPSGTSSTTVLGMRRSPFALKKINHECAVVATRINDTLSQFIH